MKIYILIVSLVFIKLLNAQTYYSTVPSTSATFLRAPTDIVQSGMGNTGIATEPNEYCPLVNISKAGFSKYSSAIVATYSPWLSDFGAKKSFISNLSFYKQLDEDQAFTTTLRYFSLGSIQFADANGNALSNYTPYEMSVDAGYTRKLNERFALGVTLRYINSSLVSGLVDNVNYKPSNAFSGDVSLFYRGIDEEYGGLNWGLTLNNLGSKLSYTSTGTGKSFLPANLGLGIAYSFYAGNDAHLQIAGDINKLLVPTLPSVTDSYQADSAALIAYGQQSVVSSWAKSFADGSNQLKNLRLSVGLEYEFQKTFFARMGYFLEDKNNGNNRYFTAGMGLRYNALGVDVAYVVPSGQGLNRSPLANTVRIGLNIIFGGEDN